MTQVAVIGDSHIPERETDIPERFRDRIRRADHVIHVGDFTSSEALDEIVSLADGDLTAVAGNMDPRTIDLPAVDTCEIDGVTFVVTHGTGSARNYAERVAGIVEEEAGSDAIGVAGHTHEVLDTVVDGVRVLNPGSVTGAAPADQATMMTIAVEHGEISVEINE